MSRPRKSAPRKPKRATREELLDLLATLFGGFDPINAAEEKAFDRVKEILDAEVMK